MRCEKGKILFLKGEGNKSRFGIKIQYMPLLLLDFVRRVFPLSPLREFMPALILTEGVCLTYRDELREIIALFYTDIWGERCKLHPVQPLLCPPLSPRHRWVPGTVR